MPKINKISVFSIFCCLFLSTFTACDKNKNTEKGNISFEFKAQYQNSNFQLDTKYAAEGTDSVSFSKINFFVAPIEFITQDNKSVIPIQEDAYFINLENNNSLKFSLTSVPEGNYKAIKLGIGLPANINSKDPNDFALSSVLNDATHYWASWNSYIFSRLEGNLFTEDIDRSNIPFLYHSGIDGTYQTITLYKDFSITSGNTINETLILQVNKIIYPNNGQNIDIRNKNSSHGGVVGTEDYNYSLQSIQNIANSIYID